jgi:hypothetical protein
MNKFLEEPSLSSQGNRHNTQAENLTKEEYEEAISQVLKILEIKRQLARIFA